MARNHEPSMPEPDALHFTFINESPQESERTSGRRRGLRSRFREMSDSELAFVDARLARHDFVDRQELDRELERRRMAGGR